MKVLNDKNYSYLKYADGFHLFKSRPIKGRYPEIVGCKCVRLYLRNGKVNIYNTDGSIKQFMSKDAWLNSCRSS